MVDPAGPGFLERAAVVCSQHGNACPAPVLPPTPRAEEPVASSAPLLPLIPRADEAEGGTAPLLPAMRADEPVISSAAPDEPALSLPVPHTGGEEGQPPTDEAAVVEGRGSPVAGADHVLEGEGDAAVQVHAVEDTQREEEEKEETAALAEGDGV